MFGSLWRNRGLVGSLVRRDVVGRYRGSFAGLAWSFFNPLLMLAIYTLVFSGVFKARWGTGIEEGKTGFAMILFVGLIMHGLFAECIGRAHGLILSNANYVKKVIFPLEILPWVALGSALFHATVSVGVLLLVQLVVRQELPWTAVYFPLILLPLLFFSVGFTWFLSALGVYVRDIGQVVGVFVTALLFLSPIFYPLSALPPTYQTWLGWNPLALMIEAARESLIVGRVPDLQAWSVVFVGSLAVAWGGFAWFQKARKGFADVI